jgi:single-strand DNA-binding protein
MSGGRTSTPELAAVVEHEARNEVVLVGRVSGVPEERELPSGDRLVAWRVVVARPTPRRPPPEGIRPSTVDTLDCVAWTPALRRTARGLVDGDVVALEGALRRRFWRAGAAAASRCEVEVSTLRRVSARARSG